MSSNIVYLVDLENIGTSILCRHMGQYPDEKYIVFYSDATSDPSSVLSQIPEKVWVRFIYCRTGGNNAMDFCISAMAGRLTAGKGMTVRVLSNDKGYDPMIRMLQEYGIRIRREPATYTQPTEQLSSDNPSVKGIIMSNVPRQYQDDVLNAICGCVNRKEAYEILQAILPQQLAQDVYRKLRKHIAKEI